MNKKVLLLLLLFGCIQKVSAQSSRSPTPQERIVIDKAVNAVVGVINGFSNNDWEITAGGADAPESYSVQRKPWVPIGVAPFNDWTFEIRQGSPLWNSLTKPYLDKIQNTSVDINDKKATDAYLKLGNEFANKKDVIVEVHVNDFGIPMYPQKDGAMDLKIPGCYFAWKQQHDNLIGTDRNLENSYVLVFGNWANVKSSGNGFYNFHFTHPPLAPYIENIVIIISGNNERISELLHKTNWNEINNGLTQ